MPLLIGLDEAGYGPNLGPLVIAATVWDVTGDPRRRDGWSEFSTVVSQEPDPDGRFVHVADSKVVHSSAAGIAAIERSATSILRLAREHTDTLFALWDRLTGSRLRAECGEPWFCGDDVPLPVATHPDGAFDIVERWSECCQATGFKLVGVACEIVPAAQFNKAVKACGSKGSVLSEATLRLVRRVWHPTDDGPALILCDKHGGRDRYAELLTEVMPEAMPLSLEESRSISRYRVGAGEVRFQVRSEEHLPVAAASLVAKYIREACMEAFNRFWLARRPDLRPTRGYPGDARRFLKEIRRDAAELGLKRGTYWRSR
jgi:ribonuclease HII